MYRRFIPAGLSAFHGMHPAHLWEYPCRVPVLRYPCESSRQCLAVCHQPFVPLMQHLQRAVNDIFLAMIRAGAQRLRYAVFLFGFQLDGQSFLLAFRVGAANVRVKFGRFNRCLTLLLECDRALTLAAQQPLRYHCDRYRAVTVRERSPQKPRKRSSTNRLISVTAPAPSGLAAAPGASAEPAPSPARHESGYRVGRGCSRGGHPSQVRCLAKDSVAHIPMQRLLGPDMDLDPE